eukprot:29891-Pelagococcus_subviridis.AAC.6
MLAVSIPNYPSTKGSAGVVSSSQRSTTVRHLHRQQLLRPEIHHHRGEDQHAGRAGDETHVSKRLLIRLPTRPQVHPEHPGDHGEHPDREHPVGEK